MNAAHPGCRGFALVPALFLMVVLAAIAVVAVRVGTGQQQAVTMNLMQARALAAANAGIEWGAYSVINGSGSCPTSPTTLTLTEGAFSGVGYSVVVTCTVTSFNNGITAGGNIVTSYAFVLNASATTGTYGQPGYARRVVSATFTSQNAT